MITETSSRRPLQWLFTRAERKCKSKHTVDRLKSAATVTSRLDPQILRRSVFESRFFVQGRLLPVNPSYIRDPVGDDHITTSAYSRLPCKSKSRRKREVSGHARESVRLIDQDSGLRTSASRRMVPASDAGPDIHLLSRARQSCHR